MADYSEAMSEISGYPKALSHAGAGGSYEIVNLTLVNKAENNGIFHVTGVMDGNKYGGILLNGYGTSYNVQIIRPTDNLDPGWPLILDGEGIRPKENTPSVRWYDGDLDGRILFIESDIEDGAVIEFVDYDPNDIG